MTFDEKFSVLGDYYNIDSPDEVKDQIKNENVLIFLDEIRPYLEESFSDGEFCLEMNFEPEMDDKFIVLMINVPQKRFDNGVGDELRMFNIKINALRRNVNVFREVLVMPGIKDV